ncbi:hypothetical protein MQE23_24545 [Streptomyces sp. HP-A2021]|uniref:hypothetical protein n=1 Tax=Streptomyces TaxID=1883 RepID=UPI00056651A2|nr:MULTISPECIES: hypothetical protein [Streptomyces]UOB12034.1 hypothetical protein MQE23_24545 [Streptomyces sp. HP-A2021]
MALPKCAERYEAGDAWLAGCSAHPALVREAWNLEALAPIPSGNAWLAAEAPLVASMQAPNRIRPERRGPVVADPTLDMAWWLVPLDAADELGDLRTVTVQPVGWPLHCPPTGWPACGRFWLTRPGGSGELTDPAVLAAAFGPGRYRRLAEASA